MSLAEYALARTPLAGTFGSAPRSRRSGARGSSLSAFDDTRTNERRRADRPGFDLAVWRSSARAFGAGARRWPGL